jgi:hypothetical protein
MQNLRPNEPDPIIPGRGTRPAAQDAHSAGENGEKLPIVRQWPFVDACVCDPDDREQQYKQVGQQIQK